MRIQARTSRLLLAAAVSTFVVSACGTTVPQQSQLAQSSTGPGLDGSGTTQGIQSGQQPGQQAGQLTGQAGAGSTTGAPLTGSSGTGGVLPGAAGPSSRGGGQAGRTGGANPTSAASIPKKGPGWDEKSIYVGVPTEEDIGAAAGALGFTFQPGSVSGDIKAIVAEVNANGGLFGRSIVPIFHDNSTTSIQSNPESVAAENCSYFTQDSKVVAVINATTPIDTDAFRACLRKHNTPLMALDYQLFDNETFRLGGTRLVAAATYNLSSFAPAWVSTLKQIGYFGGWNTTTGTASTKPPVIGFLQTDTPIGHRIVSIMQAKANSLGIKVGTSYFYPDTGTPDMSNAVLSFKTNGVTHMLTLPPAASATLSFATAANQQGYRPRYAMSSYLLPTTLVSLFRTAGVQQQLNGAMGVGWTPKADVDTAHDTPDNAAQKACRAALAKGGQTFSGDNQRFAYFVGLETCDAIHLLKDGFVHGSSLGPDALVQGLGQLGPAYPLAATYTNALSSSNHAVPGQVRDLIYTPACTCFAYKGGPHGLG